MGNTFSSEADMKVPETRDEKEILDREKIETRYHNKREFLEKIVKMFIDKCSEALSEIRQTITSGDSKALEHAAHSLKGSIGNFAAQPAFEAALRLEMMGRDDNLTHAEDAFAVLENEITLLKSELVAIISEKTK